MDLISRLEPRAACPALYLSRLEAGIFLIMSHTLYCTGMNHFLPLPFLLVLHHGTAALGLDPAALG